MRATPTTSVDANRSRRRFPRPPFVLCVLPLRTHTAPREHEAFTRRLLVVSRCRRARLTRREFGYKDLGSRSKKVGLMKIHGMNVLSRVALACLIVGASVSIAPAQCRVAKLGADAPQDYSHFGASVAIYGERAVVGEPDFENGGTTPGAAYVYELRSTGWTQTALLSASDGADFDDFGISVAIDGDTILVGADATDGPQSGAVGAVYVFHWDGTHWAETQKLAASDGASGGFFGCSVALERNSAVIGRFWDSAAATHAGAAYVFTRSGSTWTEHQKLVATSPASEDDFGWSVAISNQRIVVGAPERFSTGNDDPQLGRVFVYDRAGSSWTQSAVLTPSNAMSFDQFGISLDVDGDRIAVGAWQDTFYTPTSRNGAAYVFEKSGGAWIEKQILTAPDGAVADEFGSSIALQGGRLFVGAESRSSSYPLWGGVYVYTWTGTTWSQVDLYLPDPNASLSWFGNALAFDGNYAVVGAFIESSSQYQSGTAYVYGGEAPWSDEGFALAGTNGLPKLEGVGSNCPATTTTLVLSNARPNSGAVLIVGHTEAFLPFHGGTMVPAPDTIRRNLVTNAAGSLVLDNVWPATAPPGSQLYYQVWIRDPVGPDGLSASNAIAGLAP
jgi:hypothetical protein